MSKDIDAFVRTNLPTAQAVASKIGVDPMVLLGQWGLETGWGKSVVPGTNNLGNIKGQGVSATDNMTGSTDQYRAYPTLDAFGQDFSGLISRKYQGAMNTGPDAVAYATALKKGGYAEDPQYATKLPAAVQSVRASQGIDIDPSKIQWDAPQSKGSPDIAPQIDASKVQWDSAPAVNAKAVQPAPQQTYDPTSGMSTFDKVMAGAGKSVVDLGHGIRQLGAEVGNKAGLVSDATVADLRAQEDERKALDAPLMRTGAGTAGYVGGMLATSVIPATIGAKVAAGAGMANTANALRVVANPNTYKAAAAVGALQGSLQPVGTDDSRTMNAGLGAAGGMAGNAIVNGIGRIAQPVKNALSPILQQGADVLRNAGVPLDAAQQSGSAMLGRIRSALSDNPFTAGGETAKRVTQQSAFNNAILNTIGASGEAATPDVMSAAKNRIGQVFNDVAARNPVAYDNTLNQAITNIAQNARNELSDQQMGIITRQINNVLDKANNPGMAIDGSAYQNIKSGLDRISGGQDTAVGHWARQLRGVLDDALERSTAANGNQADYAALQQARQQWGNMRKIEGAIAVDGSGDISPAKLANIVNQKANRASSVYGAGDQTLPDLAKAGRNLLTDRLPNSGTAARATMQLLAPALVGGSYGALQGDWEKAGIGALGGIALPKAAQYAINNPAIANYLANGIGNEAVRSALMAPRNNALLNALVRRAVTPQLPVLQNGAQQ